MDLGESDNAGAEVVITGIGLATSLGLDVAATWEGIRQGRVGLGSMSEMESALPPGAMGGQALDLPVSFWPTLPREARYLRWVIEHALREVDVKGGGYPPERCATILGTTLHGIRAGGRFLRTHDPAELRHFLAGSLTRAAIQGLGLEGFSGTTCSACSSSLGAIALGVSLLQAGQADLVVAGGYDAVSEYAWAGFNSLRLVASQSVRPFAKHRQGMMVAEGYGVVVLERAAGARRRGATVMAAVDGWGESADAHHLTQPDPRGTGAARAMRAAMDRARVGPGDISMIAAHATATPDNDAAEYAAFHDMFGDTLASIPVVGFKSYLGHTLGGAGAVELILSTCAMRSGRVPPCATVEQHDVEFAGLVVAPPGGLEKRITHTLNTSLGFGGANTCIILGRGSQDRAAQVVSPLATPRESPEVWITGCGMILPGITGVSMLMDRLRMLDGPVVPRGASISHEQLGAVPNVKRVRRLSPCVKFMLASVSLAIKHADLESDAHRLALASAILASTHGSPGYCAEYYSQIVRDGVLSANPMLFAEGVPNAAAAHVSTTFGIQGACQTIIGSRTAGLDALGLAAMRIRTGANQTVIVGAAEESHECLDRAYGHFDPRENRGDHAGFFISPGSVALVVESSVSAQARGAKPLARIGNYASLSPSRTVRDGVACGVAFDASARVLRQVRASGVVLGSGNHTWIDRSEALAVRGSPGMTLAPPLLERVGDLFAAGPLLAIVHAIAQGLRSPTTSLCTDFAGTAAAVVIDKAAHLDE